MTRDTTHDTPHDMPRYLRTDVLKGQSSPSAVTQSETSVKAALHRLEAAGFEDQVFVEGQHARFASGGPPRPADALTVDRIVRAEDESDAGYNTMVLGIRELATGRRGTLVAPFGGAATDAALFAQSLDENGA